MVRMVTEVITTENLSKSYGSKKAVQNLCIRLKPGISGFIGPNGSGKTTTMTMLIGLVKPSSGKGYVLGHDILTETQQIKEKTGYMPEDPKLYSEMSARSFLKFIAKVRGSSSSDSYVNELLKEFELTRVGDNRISSYSGGMITRLALTTALVGDPELLLLDEPTAHLDPLAREHALDLIKQQRKQGKSIFISSHVLSELERICDYVSIIDAGRILLQGETQELISRFSQNRYLVETSRPDDFLASLQGQPCVKDVWKEGNSIIIVPEDESAMKRCIIGVAYEKGYEFSRFLKVTPSLQEFFVSLIKENREGEGGTLNN